MGKSLIIKGADFSANGISENVPLDITSLVSQSEKWIPRKRITDLSGTNVQADNYKCCLQRFDIDSVPNSSNYSKIRITFAEGLNYVFSIGTGSSASNYVRVTGIDTTNTDFDWTTDNLVGEIAFSETRHIFSFNVRIGSGSTTMDADRTLASCAKIELIP